jgi:hypothetical protein
MLQGDASSLLRDLGYHWKWEEIALTPFLPILGQEYRKPPACGIGDYPLCESTATKSQAGCLCYFKKLILAPIGGCP